MARITVEDCLDKVENRFQLVLVAAKRARQIALGSKALVDEEHDKPTVIALRELADGKITADEIRKSRNPVRQQPVRPALGDSEDYSPGPIIAVDDNADAAADHSSSED